MNTRPNGRSFANKVNSKPHGKACGLPREFDQGMFRRIIRKRIEAEWEEGTRLGWPPAVKRQVARHKAAR